MRQDEADKNRRKGHLLMFYWLGIMTILLLLAAATYTWFSISKTPRVNDMDLYVSSGTGIELALAPDAPDEAWGRTVDFNDMVSETSPLRPCTWSEAGQRFYAASYGMDGRLTDRWTPLTDEENANAEGSSGYYITGTLYARSDTAVAVALSEAITLLEDNTETAGTYVIGTPVWNEQEVLHNNGGAGAEYAIRIGLRVTPILSLGGEEEGKTPAPKTSATPAPTPTARPGAAPTPTPGAVTVDPETGIVYGEPTFYIYEPNCDGHIDGAEGYVETASIDGAETLVPVERLIRQTTSSWEETYPVRRTATLKTMGTFTEDSQTALFSLAAGGMERIDLYIWLEGQDIDCSDMLSSEAQILANVQFGAAYASQSGMVPIQ